VSGLETEKVGQLGDQRPIEDIAFGNATLIVNQVEVAQRAVNPSKANITGDKPIAAIVLNEGTQEGSRIERIVNAGTDQVG
jgi:hypothetical protein